MKFHRGSLAILGFVAVALIAAPLAVPASIPPLLGSRVEDFGAYWCAAKVAQSGRNPYDVEQLRSLESAIEPRRTDPIITWSPPWAITLAVPHSSFPFPAARLSWMIFQLLALAGCAAVIWFRSGGRADRFGVAWLLTFTFYPVLQLIALGQMSLFALLGIVGFLAWHARVPFLAGACLALTFVKPHNVIPFGIAVIIWVIAARAWKVAVGGAVALLAWTLIALAMNPSFFSLYRETMSANPPGKMMPPTAGTLLRMALNDHQGLWIQFVPTAIASAWAIWFTLRNRSNWNWQTAAAPLLFASVLGSPYGWIYDAVLLLVPILALAARGVAYSTFWLVCYLLVTAICLIHYACGGEEVALVWMPWLLFAGWWVNRKPKPIHPLQTTTP